MTRCNLKVARAWRIKEAASTRWSYSYRGVAERTWKALLGWISRCRLEPTKGVGRMVQQYLWGIIDAIVHRVTHTELRSATLGIRAAYCVAFLHGARYHSVSTSSGPLPAVTHPAMRVTWASDASGMVPSR